MRAIKDFDILIINMKNYLPRAKTPDIRLK